MLCFLHLRSFGHRLRMGKVPRPDFRLPKLIWLLVSLLLASFSLAGASGIAGSVSLGWDASPEPDIIGYRVHYGTSSGNYTQVIDVGNSTDATISNLIAGTTYFFAVTAYDTAALESEPSNEVAFTLPPAISPVVINSMKRGSDGTMQMTLTVPDPLFGPSGMVHVYFSSDLVAWTWLKDVPISSGTVVINDPGASSVKQRFYRLSF